MKTKFDLDLSSATSGFIAGLVYASDVSSWWYLACIPPLFSFEIPGLPWAKLSYETGKGFSWRYGRYR